MKKHSFENSPQEKYIIGEKKINIDSDALTELLLEKEKELLNKYPGSSDGGTNLGLDSVTSRFQYFNVMDKETWDYDIIHKIRKEIKTFYKEYLKSLFGQDHKVPTTLIRCWFNVMRRGQQIQQHIHASHEHAYFGGHLIVKCNDSSTMYVNPNEQDKVFELKNEVGGLTLFPSYVPHYTTVHNGDEPRITIAFDLSLSDAKIEIFKDLVKPQVL